MFFAISTGCTHKKCSKDKTALSFNLTKTNNKKVPIKLNIKHNLNSLKITQYLSFLGISNLSCVDYLYKLNVGPDLGPNRLTL